MNNGFMFRFTTSELKQEFHIASVKINKSMNKLLNELVVCYLNDIKEK